MEYDILFPASSFSSRQVIFDRLKTEMTYGRQAFLYTDYLRVGINDLRIKSHKETIDPWNRSHLI